jgi:histidinol-phosphate aminotransferase
MLRARESVRTLATYHPPLAGRQGLRLDFNENAVGCSPRVLARLRDLTAEDIARYPERAPVEAQLATHFGIMDSELLLTNGVDEAIHLLCETFLEPADEALIVVPTFAMYGISAAATGARVVNVPAGRDFRFPTSDVLNRITQETRLIAIANPNNPTGAVAQCEDLLEIARRAPQAAILVDEAYFEFYGKTLAPAWREFPNIFVARTFSKAYGMAGLRVGALMGDPEQLSFVRRVASPYSVNAVALACLISAVEDETYVNQYVSEVLRGRDLLQQTFEKWEIPYWKSEANFVLARFGTQTKAFIDSMRERGILVRDRSNDYGCQGCVRITLGTIEQSSRLLEAITQTVTHLTARTTKEQVTR